MDEENIFDVPSEVIPDTPEIPLPTESEQKIDKAADIFVTIALTLGQLILAALLITFGLSFIPIIKFTFLTIIRILSILIGIKFVVAGYQQKRL